jgi:hypothetical protein
MVAVPIHLQVARTSAEGDFTQAGHGVDSVICADHTQARKGGHSSNPAVVAVKYGVLQNMSVKPPNMHLSFIGARAKNAFAWATIRGLTDIALNLYLAITLLI